MSEMLPAWSLGKKANSNFAGWVALAGMLLLLFNATACISSSDKANPTIKFTHIPPADPGGPIYLGTVAGRVNGPHDGLQLVLYARSGLWYVQPYTEQPFTTI